MLDVVASWSQLEGRILCLIVACIWDIMMRYGHHDEVMVTTDGNDGGCVMVVIMVMN